MEFSSDGWMGGGEGEGWGWGVFGLGEKGEKFRGKAREINSIENQRTAEL